MATKDRKDIPGMGPGNRDDLSGQGPNTSPNTAPHYEVDRDPNRGGVPGSSLEPDIGSPRTPLGREPSFGQEADHLRREARDAANEAKHTLRREAQDMVHEAREGAREMADQIQHKASDMANRASRTADEAADTAKQYADQVDTFVRQQTDEHPWLMVFGAALTGYVVAGGIPRFAVRWVARFGLPIAATVALAQYLSRENQRIHHDELIRRDELDRDLIIR